MAEQLYLYIVCYLVFSVFLMMLWISQILYQWMLGRWVNEELEIVWNKIGMAYWWIYHVIFLYELREIAHNFSQDIRLYGCDSD